MVTRRQFIKYSAATAGGLLIARYKFLRGKAAIPGGSLDPLTIPQFVEKMIIPPAMPKSTSPSLDFDYYEIAVRQFTQRILPQSMNLNTTVWSYGSVNHPGTFNYPAFTIESQVNRPVRVKWINDLVDGSGNYLPHLLPVDPTLHWANPPGGVPGRDMRPMFETTPGPYTGPVPIVTHLHGSHAHEESDGFAEAWFLPNATNIPPTYADVGSYYNFFRAEFARKYHLVWDPGSATFQYLNDQRAATLWYHDHTLGMTRVNVYVGPAGFYLLRGGPDDMVTDSRSGTAAILPGPAPSVNQIPDDPTGVYEIPIGIQDRSFNDNGSLFYPSSRDFFDTYPGPYIPETDISPIWNPEFFGNTMVVNGRTWPYLTVEKRHYRFRILNGCNSRFLILKMSNNMPFWVIGSEGGFLPTPIQVPQLLLAPAERLDVILDFHGQPEGNPIHMLNLGPDEPFKGFNPDGSLADGEGGVLPPSDPLTTGLVMEFRVVARLTNDPSTPPANLVLPAIKNLGLEDNTRQVSLNEVMSMTEFEGPVEALLGTMSAGEPEHLHWADPITENPALGATEVWEIFNFTADAHPIHIHEVMFEVVNRETNPGGVVRGPESWETGLKDTVIAYPGEITRVKALFDRPGLFVWHCHIVEHEDNEMMRPYMIGSRKTHLPFVMK